MKRSLLSLLLVFALFSCGKKASKYILNSENLAPQTFSVDINKDTVLKTNDGCIVQIPAGSLLSDKNPVQLEIKEAISNQEIVLAGLNTMSGKDALSSGGMLYINAASGYTVSVKKQLTIMVPTKTYNRDMNVYEGVENKEGKINWTNPTPLPKDETTTTLDAGKNIFTTNCSACHAINKKLTGPALYGITYRKGKEWIYEYTQSHYIYKRDSVLNESASDFDIAESDLYHRCLSKKYNHVRAPYFHFSNEEMNALYTYIKNESDKRPDLKDSITDNCCDSCVMYTLAKQQIESGIKKLTAERNKLIETNEASFSLKRTIPGTINNLPPASNNTTPSNTSNLKNTKVEMVNKPSVYYTINVKAMGWYNIDILMKNISNCVASELMVRIQGNYQLDFNVTLAIPSVKAFVEGGKLSNQKDYGFDENDGSINLPQGARCVVMAYALKEDVVLYGTATFNASTKQLIEIAIKEIPKEQLRKEIESLGLDGVSGEARDSKNAAEIRKNDQLQIEWDKKLAAIEFLKPKNCDCNYFVKDTTAKIEIDNAK